MDIATIIGSEDNKTMNDNAAADTPFIKCACGKIELSMLMKERCNDCMSIDKCPVCNRSVPTYYKLLCCVKHCKICNDVVDPLYHKTYCRTCMLSINQEWSRKRKLLYSNVQRPNEKKCNICNVVKLADQFYRSNRNKTGLDAACKNCIKNQRIKNTKICTKCKCELRRENYGRQKRICNNCLVSYGRNLPSATHKTYKFINMVPKGNRLISKLDTNPL